MKKLFTLKKVTITFVILALVVVGMIVICNAIINKTTEKQVYSDVNLIPHNKVGVVLGTSKYLSSGRLNLYFVYRIDAAVELYRAGKVDFLVVSGDNSRKDYNEPLDMKNELVRRGIPENKIYLDYAGFRTLDSIVRMNKIFGQHSFTIISQEFHNQRAIYIANRLGLNTVGFNAQDVDVYNGFKTKLREKFARVKVFIDFLIGKKPRFLGEQIEIK
ncbi:MAG: YdcF family protein [Dysgonamonadaceae bacterium]|jgi:SanA protein|nr:YdcF family protein [Dysgonamonadaceae bacterium]